MKTAQIKRAGGAGFQPVQFGSLPNCGEARGFAVTRSIHQQCRVSLVPGRTPETTGWKPVPPGAIEIFRHA